MTIAISLVDALGVSCIFYPAAFYLTLSLSDKQFARQAIEERGEISERDWLSLLDSRLLAFAVSTLISAACLGQRVKNFSLFRKNMQSYTVALVMLMVALCNLIDAMRIDWNSLDSVPLPAKPLNQVEIPTTGMIYVFRPHFVEEHIGSIVLQAKIKFPTVYDPSGVYFDYNTNELKFDDSPGESIREVLSEARSAFGNDHQDHYGDQSYLITVNGVIIEYQNNLGGEYGADTIRNLACLNAALIKSGSHNRVYLRVEGLKEPSLQLPDTCLAVTDDESIEVSDDDILE